MYGIDGRLDDSFPKNTLTILKELAALAAEWNSYPDLKLDGQGPVSRVSATLNLCYHQVRLTSIIAQQTTNNASASY